MIENHASGSFADHYNTGVKGLRAVSSGSIPARLLPGAPSQPQNFHLEQRVTHAARNVHANFISGNEPPSQGTQRLSQPLLLEDDTLLSAQGVRHVESRQRLSLFEPQKVDFSVDGLNPGNGFPMDAIMRASRRA